MGPEIGNVLRAERLARESLSFHLRSLLDAEIPAPCAENCGSVESIRTGFERDFFGSPWSNLRCDNLRIATTRLSALWRRRKT